jgi:hypothetical protein
VKQVEQNGAKTKAVKLNKGRRQKCKLEQMRGCAQCAGEEASYRSRHGHVTWVAGGEGGHEPSDGAWEGVGKGRTRRDAAGGEEREVGGAHLR